MKYKGFYATKETVTKLKRLPIEWEKIFASYTSDKGSTTRIHKELKKLKSQKINDPAKEWANELNRAFATEKVQMAKKTHKEMLNIPGHKGNANQNHVKMPPHSC
jgi:hypothetical protein